MNNILKFAKKEITAPAPTDNQIVVFQKYFDKLIRYLEFHATQNVQTRPVQDLIRLRNSVVRASYVSIIFDQLLVQDPDSISTDYDMSEQVKRIMDLTVGDVYETVQKPVAIATVVAVDDILQSIIEQYYFNQVNRPWWKFWG